MNRRNFLSKLAIGAAAVVVAPKILIPKEEATVMGVKEILDIRNHMMNSIANIPVSQWGTFEDYERLNLLDMQMRMEQAYLFGERRESNRKFMTGKEWIQ